MTGRTSSDELQAILNSTLTNKTDIVYGPDGAKLNYWLGSPVESSTFHEMTVSGDHSSVSGSGMGKATVNFDIFGLRPVLVVLKSNI